MVLSEKVGGSLRERLVVLSEKVGGSLREGWWFSQRWVQPVRELGLDEGSLGQCLAGRTHPVGPTVALPGHGCQLRIQQVSGLIDALQTQDTHS